MTSSKGDPGNESYPPIIIATGLIRFEQNGEDRPVFLEGYTVNESEERIPIHVDLQSALPALSLPQREALVVWLVEERTEVEAAHQLGITRQALRKRTRAAVLHLRRVLCK